jgi:hypothetical protein
MSEAQVHVGEVWCKGTPDPWGGGVERVQIVQTAPGWVRYSYFFDDGTVAPSRYAWKIEQFLANGWTRDKAAELEQVDARG